MAPVDSSNGPPKAKIRHTAKEQIPTTYQASCSTAKSMVSSAKKQIPKQSDSSPAKDVQSQEDHPVYQGFTIIEVEYFKTDVDGEEFVYKQDRALCTLPGCNVDVTKKSSTMESHLQSQHNNVYMVYMKAKAASKNLKKGVNLQMDHLFARVLSLPTTRLIWLLICFPK
uniref:Uncharacterized protein n=1 Tax=Ditylenchus dipsaci TaxID=166011 RepID=A0A915E960_9BILA